MTLRKARIVLFGVSAAPVKAADEGGPAQVPLLLRWRRSAVAEEGPCERYHETTWSHVVYEVFPQSLRLGLSLGQRRLAPRLRSPPAHHVLGAVGARAEVATARVQEWHALGDNCLRAGGIRHVFAARHILLAIECSLPGQSQSLSPFPQVSSLGRTCHIQISLLLRRTRLLRLFAAYNRKALWRY